LTTKEGDKVSISFDQQDLWRMQQGKTSANRKALEAYGDNSGGAGKSEYAASRTQSGSSAYYSHSVGFSFSVDGNLSQDELKAIGGLVDQIGSLSDSFSAAISTAHWSRRKISPGTITNWQASRWI